MAGVLNILFDLTLLPARSRIAKIHVKQVVAGHSGEAGIDLPLLAYADPIDSCAHVVVDPAPRNAAQRPERMIMGVKQHLVGLKKIGAEKKRAAVRQFEVRHLQLDPLAADDRPILAPVELERLSRLKDQWNKRSAPAGLLFTLPFCLPRASKGGDATVGTLVAKGDQIRMQLFERAFLLAWLARFRLQPTRQLVSKSIQFAWPVWDLELRLDSARSQILADRVARQTRPPRNLPDRKLIA